MDKIKITDLKIFAHHGVYEEETRNGQDFYVNAVMYLDCRRQRLPLSTFFSTLFV